MVNDILTEIVKDYILNTPIKEDKRKVITNYKDLEKGKKYGLSYYNPNSLSSIKGFGCHAFYSHKYKDLVFYTKWGSFKQFRHVEIEQLEFYTITELEVK